MVDTAQSIEQAASGGLTQLMNVNPLTTLLVLIVMALCWIIRELIRDIRTERDRVTTTLINVAAVMAEQRTLITMAVQK